MNNKLKSSTLKNYGVFTATALVVANMIGAGIFTTSGIMASNLPSPLWVLFCWGLGGIIALSGALCYAELATRIPKNGGEYIYLKELFHPILGFLTGWTSLIVGFSVPIALSAMGFTEYLLAGLSLELTGFSTTEIMILKKILSISIILVFTMIHFFGAKIGGRVQNFLTILKIIVILGLTSWGLFSGDGSFGHIFSEIKIPGDGFAFGTAMMMVMFTYSGWNAASYISGELKNPRKTLPISLLGGTIIVILLYLALNVFIFFSAPYSELQGKITIVEVASVKVFGGWIAKLLSFCISIMLLSSLGAYLLIGPRVYYAMAKDKLFFSFASKMSQKYKVPNRSILLQGGIAVTMVIIGSFEQLLIYIGFALGIFPIVAVFGLFKARKKGIGESMAVKTPWYPVTPIFFILSSFLLLIIAFYNRPLESLVAIFTVTAGIPCYYIWQRFKK